MKAMFLPTSTAYAEKHTNFEDIKEFFDIAKQRVV